RTGSGLLTPAMLLPPRRKLETQTGEKVQWQRWKSQRSFVLLVREVVQLAVNFNAARQLVGEAGIGKDVALRVEQALQVQRARKGTQVGLNVEDLAADVSVGVEHKSAMAPGHVETSRLARTPQQGLANLEGSTDAAAAIECQHF